MTRAKSYQRLLKFERDRENSYRYRNATLLLTRESHHTLGADQTQCYPLYMMI